MLVALNQYFEGEEKNNLFNQIKNYSSKDSILFLGRRDDVPALLKLSNLFILPTLFEGQSNAILEAMAAGIPVITTDIPENQELVTDKKTGILVPIKNSPLLAKAINGLLGDEQQIKNLSENSKRRILENFNTKIIVLKLNQFFDEL